MKQIWISFLMVVTLGFSAHANVSSLASPAEKAALALLKKMPSSEYGTRQLCVYLGRYAVGTYPAGHWSQGTIVARGTVQAFPTQQSKLTENQKAPLQLAYPNGPTDWGRFKKIAQEANQTKFYVTQGTVDGRPADICVFEHKMVLEGVGG